MHSELSSSLEWFKRNLYVGSYPLPMEILNSEFDYIINVSDEYIRYCHDAAMQKGIKYFWFPMNEHAEIGLNSIYGALQILHEAEELDKKVLLHCHAGANRSPTVADAYYYMRGRKHFIRRIDADLERDLNIMFGRPADHKSELNMLLVNCARGYLPAIDKMEQLLIGFEAIFQKDICDRQGGLDRLKFEMLKN